MPDCDHGCEHVAAARLESRGALLHVAPCGSSMTGHGHGCRCNLLTNPCEGCATCVLLSSGACCPRWDALLHVTLCTLPDRAHVTVLQKPASHWGSASRPAAVCRGRCRPRTDPRVLSLRRSQPSLCRCKPRLRPDSALRSWHSASSGLDEATSRSKLRERSMPGR